jgi:hypothetical protein
MSNAAKLKQMMGGGAPPAPGEAPAQPAPGSDAAADRIRQAEQGQVQTGAAKKAVSAAAKLKNLKL